VTTTGRPLFWLAHPLASRKPHSHFLTISTLTWNHGFRTPSSNYAGADLEDAPSISSYGEEDVKEYSVTKFFRALAAGTGFPPLTEGEQADKGQRIYSTAQLPGVCDVVDCGFCMLPSL
jgi:hypothetical protein